MFSASGAVVGVRKGFDLFGIAVMGVLTGVGGGILRDLLLDISPPYSIQHWENITVALGCRRARDGLRQTWSFA